MLRPADSFDSEPPIGFTQQVLVLPLRFEDDYGVYDTSVVDMVKVLKGEGIDAAFLHAAPDRRWRSLKGEAPIDFILAISCAVTADIIKMALLKLFSSLRSPRVRAKVMVDYYADGNIARKRFEFDGDRETFIESLDKMINIGETKNNRDE